MMKATLIALTASLALVGTASASDVTGVWRTADSGGRIEINRCGASICGKIIGGEAAPGQATTDVKNKDAALRNRPLNGLVILKGFSGGPSEWTGGTIYNPKDGGTYMASVKLAAEDMLQVKGCVAAMLCQTQTWKRLK
jgi:uncharacterized protein (DUF2147 family)